MTLKILFVNLNLAWKGGGTFYRALGFAERLVAKGHEVTLMSTSPENRWQFSESEHNGVRIVETPSVLFGKLRSGWDPYETWRRMSWISDHQFDLVHGFESRPNVIYPTLFTQRRHNATVCLDWCDWFGRGGAIEERSKMIQLVLAPFENYFEENFRARADGTTTINSQLRDRAVGLGIKPADIMWLPNGAETDKIQPLDKIESRKKLGMDLERPIIGHLGHVWDSDERLMKDSFDALKKEIPSVQLLLFGNSKTSLFDGDIQTGHAIKAGFIPPEQLSIYLSAADLHWIIQQDTVTNRGRWSMKLNDYMSSGRPIVFTGIGDSKRLFTEEYPIGKLALPEANSIAQTTADLLRDPIQREIFGNNGRHQIETTFAWEIVTDRLEAFYLETIAKKRRRDA